MPVIIIVEDDGLLGYEMQRALALATTAVVRLAASVARARSILVQERTIDFAFLNVKAEDGDTFDLARQIISAGVPVAFVTGTDPQLIPSDLAHCPVFIKPCLVSSVLRALPYLFSRTPRGLSQKEG